MNQTSTATIDVTSISRIDHDEAMQITAIENRKFAESMKSLSPTQWSTPTECTRWDVRAMAAHLVGSAASQASPREFLRQKRGGKPKCKELGSPFWWDGMNELQVCERASSTTEQLIAEWSTVSAKALKSRTKMPRPIAGLKLLNLPEPVGRQPLSYLFDIGFTRDVWAHRIDIAHAIAVEPDHDAAHDGRILADIVAEWAATHRQPFTLVLDGPAGGTFVQGTSGEEVHISVVDFVRTLAERTTASGVLRHTLPL
ncbi:maleylpyruvate isomerase family mycothiol-dependent enzyme [Ilumatobacter nonamiensis]|uniref:maleylpyruvate isomerase family mycothiol-dependent enzyme n=1 Tax=Ilumatobacter nonamiensis TaxID=467093 RepID=UPI001F4CDF41|nr:maleylpyruvate isomerase family mycothiol-dependent enzyme [Ilumatobacter nonamiensis]